MSTSPDPHARRRTVAGRTAATTRTSTSGTGGLGDFSAQIGSDGVEPAVGIGGGLTVDSGGDLGLRIAPGVSVDLAPSSGDC